MGLAPRVIGEDLLNNQWLMFSLARSTNALEIISEQKNNPATEEENRAEQSLHSRTAKRSPTQGKFHRFLRLWLNRRKTSPLLVKMYLLWPRRQNRHLDMFSSGSMYSKLFPAGLEEELEKPTGTQRQRRVTKSPTEPSALDRTKKTGHGSLPCWPKRTELFPVLKWD